MRCDGLEGGYGSKLRSIMALTPLALLLVVAAAFAAGFALARRLAGREATSSIAPPEHGPPEQDPPEQGSLLAEAIAKVSGESVVRFEVLAERGTRSIEHAEHAEEWRSAMADVGSRLRAEGVVAIVFAHGSFVGNDPLSALALVERALPGGRPLAKALRRHTRAYVDRLLGDRGSSRTSRSRRPAEPPERGRRDRRSSGPPDARLPA